MEGVSEGNTINTVTVGFSDVAHFKAVSDGLVFWSGEGGGWGVCGGWKSETEIKKCQNRGAQNDSCLVKSPFQ